MERGEKVGIHVGIHRLMCGGCICQNKQVGLVRVVACLCMWALV